MHLHFKNLWPTLSVEPSDFIQTTEERHKSVVKEALQRLYDKGDIYEREYEGWYSPSVNGTGQKRTWWMKLSGKWSRSPVFEGKTISSR